MVKMEMKIPGTSIMCKRSQSLIKVLFRMVPQLKTYTRGAKKVSISRGDIMIKIKGEIMIDQEIDMMSSIITMGSMLAAILLIKIRDIDTGVSGGPYLTDMMKMVDF